MIPAHVYEVRLRKYECGVNLISDTLPFGRLWYAEPNGAENAVGYAKRNRRIARKEIKTHEQVGASVLRDSFALDAPFATLRASTRVNFVGCSSQASDPPLDEGNQGRE